MHIQRALLGLVVVAAVAFAACPCGDRVDLLKKEVTMLEAKIQEALVNVTRASDRFRRTTATVQCACPAGTKGARGDPGLPGFPGKDAAPADKGESRESCGCGCGFPAVPF
jgi:hypothetical protein